MTNTSIAAAMIAAVGIAAPLSAAAVNVGDTLGTDQAAIQSALEAEGFTISEIEIEDGEIEFEVTRDGAELEISVAADSGVVTEIELEDADGDDDDDND